MLTVSLTFRGTTATITSNKDDMFDLNDIHRAFCLPMSKQPKQWRNAHRAKLEQGANLRPGNFGGTNRTWATQKALYAYAMWCDVDFYDAVVDAFTSLANGDVESAMAHVESVTGVYTQRAILLYSCGKKAGVAMRKALESLNYDFPRMEKLINEVARQIPSWAASQRDAYWKSVSTILVNMQNDYRMRKHFCLFTYLRFESLHSHCAKRERQLAKARLARQKQTTGPFSHVSKRFHHW